MAFQFPEGATPINDCSGLIPQWVQNLKDLNRIEAENILDAQKKYLKQRIKNPKTWFYPERFKQIHKDMFGKVWSWAGTYRKNVTSIGVKPAFIPFQLAEFSAEVASYLENPTNNNILEISAKIHHRLVYIHPFENGNGRFSRLVADRFLLSLKWDHPIWPSNLNHVSSERKEYIQALKDADFGNFEPLIAIMKRYGAKEKV